MQNNLLQGLDDVRDELNGIQLQADSREYGTAQWATRGDLFAVEQDPVLSYAVRQTFLVIDPESSVCFVCLTKTNNFNGAL